MITAQVGRRQGKVTSLLVKGHSGLASEGNDIVCAGVSSLVQAALLGLGKHLDRRLFYKVRKGDLQMRLLDAPDDLTEAILATALLGLREIEKLHPEALKIMEE